MRTKRSFSSFGMGSNAPVVTAPVGWNGPMKISVCARNSGTRLPTLTSRASATVCFIIKIDLPAKKGLTKVSRRAMILRR